MFLLLTCIGPFTRAWAVPKPNDLTTGSPTLGTPAVISVIPGSYASTGPGYQNFPIPNYNVLTITAKGGGGGGTLDSGVITAARDGGFTEFATTTPIVANGGLAGVGPPPPAQGGSGGIVTVGGGGAGGLGLVVSGSIPSPNYAGSAAGRVTKTWNRLDADAPIPGTIIGLVVGTGGTAASSGTPITPGVNSAWPGENGSVNLNWS